MKKILLLLVMISSLYSEAQFYIGANYGTFNESLNGDLEAYNVSQTTTFKMGYAERETYGIEFSLDYTPNDSKIFSSSENVQTDGDKYGLNVSLSKAFDYDIYILPFVKAGFGAGFFDIDRVLDDKLYYGSFNIGAGILLPVNDNFDFELGYDYRYTSYEAIDMVAKKELFTSNIGIAYFGFNIRY